VTADELVQSVDGGDRVTDTQARHRDAVDGIVRADAHVGTHGHHDAAAHAKAVDHGDDRLGELAQLAARRTLRRSCPADLDRLIAELADVGTGGEGAFAGAPQTRPPALRRRSRTRRAPREIGEHRRPIALRFS
jgi:hypothetical protein